MNPSVSTRLRGVARGAAICLVCGTSVMLSPAWAQAPEPMSAPSDLRTAVDRAWARHPAAAATQATLDAAVARAEAASQPLYNPELEFNADDEGPDRSATAGIGLTLDLSGKRRARSDVAGADLDAATATARLRRRDFAQTWLDAWATVGAAERRVALGTQRAALLARAADLAVRQFKAGDISNLDRDLALLARDEAAAEQATLLADAAAAKAAFQSVDAGSSVPPPVTPFPVAPATSITAGPAFLVETLPEWTVVQSTAASATAQVAVAERDRAADPTVSLRGGSIELANGVRDEMYGITLTVPLFVRNSYRAELAAAKADARAATADLEQARYELQARADRTSGTYRAVHAAWQQWQQSPGTNVDVRADLLERLWRAGEMSTSDYLLQVKQTVDTALARAELEGRLWTSFTDYLAATGRLEQWLGLAAANGEKP
jgi:cobalt-zinc-cadmium efflux system outer membrane protein